MAPSRLVQPSESERRGTVALARRSSRRPRRGLAKTHWHWTSAGGQVHRSFSVSDARIAAIVSAWALRLPASIEADVSARKESSIGSPSATKVRDATGRRARAE